MTIEEIKKELDELKKEFDSLGEKLSKLIDLCPKQEFIEFEKYPGKRFIEVPEEKAGHCYGCVFECEKYGIGCPPKHICEEKDIIYKEI